MANENLIDELQKMKIPMFDFRGVITNQIKRSELYYYKMMKLSKNIWCHHDLKIVFFIKDNKIIGPELGIKE